MATLSVFFHTLSVFDTPLMVTPSEFHNDVWDK